MTQQAFSQLARSHPLRRLFDAASVGFEPTSRDYACLLSAARPDRRADLSAGLKREIPKVLRLKAAGHNASARELAAVAASQLAPLMAADSSRPGVFDDDGRAPTELADDYVPRSPLTAGRPSPGARPVPEPPPEVLELAGEVADAVATRPREAAAERVELPGREPLEA